MQADPLITDQCIHLACKKPAWAEDGKRSYFCLLHAHSAARGQLVFTPPQWDIFNKEGFIDHLVPEECGYGKRIPRYEMMNIFPVDFTMSYRFTQSAPVRDREQTSYKCMRCDKRVVSRARHCGTCRKALGLPEDEDNGQTMARCQHWRAEPEPGHVFLKNCKYVLPKDQMVPMGDEMWCAPCRMTIYAVKREVRAREGYTF